MRLSVCQCVSLSTTVRLSVCQSVHDHAFVSVPVMLPLILRLWPQVFPFKIQTFCCYIICNPQGFCLWQYSSHVRVQVDEINKHAVPYTTHLWQFVFDCSQLFLCDQFVFDCSQLFLCDQFVFDCSQLFLCDQFVFDCSQLFLCVTSCVSL